MLDLGWPLSEKARSDIDDKKRKASKEIRVDAMRDAVEFSQRTSARGRGKVVLVFPAEQMNAVTANALLKTLEEPPGDVKFVLATESAHQLLPTIRSRCIGHNMVWPELSQAVQWLRAQNIPDSDAAILLKATGGRPDDVLAYVESGRKSADWAQFPKAMARGDVGFIKEWGAAPLIDALHKLCHDLLALHAGASPRFFDTKDLPSNQQVANLTQWNKSLAQAMRTMDHPFNAGLMQEALVAQAQTALNSKH
jgi:DNA polymerase-3 subunit delta'